MSTGNPNPNTKEPPKQLAARPATIKEWINSDEMKEAVAHALPTHMAPSRFIRVALNALIREPKIAQCTQASVFSCMLQLSQYGLEADGRRAHLIPRRASRKNLSTNQWEDYLELTLQIDWKGLAELVYRSGLVSYLHADVVRRGDIFVYSKGELKDHVPWYMRDDSAKPKESGDRFAAYALVRMKDGTEKCEVVPKEQILAIRNGSEGWKAFVAGKAKQSPWNPEVQHSESEMWKKTAFRRLSKWLTLSPQIRKAAEDDDIIDVDYEEAPVQDVTATRSTRLTMELPQTLPGDEPEPERQPGAESAVEMGTAYAGIRRRAELVVGEPEAKQMRLEIAEYLADGGLTQAGANDLLEIVGPPPTK